MAEAALQERKLEINPDDYEPVDLKDYKKAQLKHYHDRQWFKGIDENRPIPDSEIDEEIATYLERNFRRDYFTRNLNDPTKVKKKEITQLPISPIFP